jgi:asparagine synthase (glutamine-hydrolysing)
MPGICGIISKAHVADHARQVSLMANTMVHGDVHTSGMWCEPESGICVGWATHRGSFTDCQPILNEKRDIILVFYGENFADRSVTDGLKRRNHSFNARNASYLVHLYEEHGEKFLADLNGWFAGVLIDRRAQKVVLFNDRFGMQRLYYHEAPNALYFSSEAKAILKVVETCRHIETRGLAEFFVCDCALEHRTLFRDVHLMPGGSRWVAAPGGPIAKSRYFDPATWENQTLLDTEFLEERLQETLKTVVSRYFRSEEPVGISLTGGLDTRILMAYLDPSPQRYPCYTFGGLYRDSYDVRIARQVAQICRQSHQVIPLDGEFLARFPQHAEQTVYISDGGMDVTGAADLYVNRAARSIAPVRVTGNYGSEVLRGVRFLKAAPPSDELFNPDFRAHVHAAVRTCDDVSQGHPLSFTLFRDLPWHEYHRLSVEQSQLIPRSPFMDNELVGLMYRATPEVRGTKHTSLRLIEKGRPELAAVRSDRGVKGHRTRSVARLWYEFLFRAEYAYNYGMPQWLARVDHALAPLHLERLFLGRHKFHHFRPWFRDQLAGYVRDVLLDSRSLQRAHVNGAVVRHMVESHTAGVHNYTTEITKLLTAELATRLLVEDI